MARAARVAGFEHVNLDLIYATPGESDDDLRRTLDEADWENARWARFETLRLHRWSSGRVAVLGDAAHAMPPYLGQGAGHAKMNARGLADAVGAASTTKTSE